MGYIELPADSDINTILQKSRIRWVKCTPTKPAEPQNGGDEEAEDTDEGFPPVTPELRETLEKCGIWPKRQNVAEPDPEPIPVPTPEPIPEDTTEMEDHQAQSGMIPISDLAYILLKPFVMLLRYSKCLAKALYVALPILLVAFAIWVYVFGEPVDRIYSAFEELTKDRNEARNSWSLF